jgi:phenylalanyl-tRNA synthetase beta subunit
MAREISAIFKTPFRSLDEPVSLQADNAIEYLEKQVPALCPRYTGIAISNVKLASSPLCCRSGLHMQV